MVSKRSPEFLWIGLALFLIISLNNEPVRALQEPIDEPVATANYQVPETDDPGTLERFMDALLPRCIDSFTPSSIDCLIQ